MTAITAITAQNTVGVDAVEPVSPETIVAQVRAVAEDIGVDAVKIGMLGTAETIDAVVEALALVGDAPVVVDPVMVAESGAVLLDDEARAALVERLLPLADGRHAEHPRGARADRSWGRGHPGGAGAGGARRSARGRSSSPAATASELVDLFFDGARGRCEIEGERHPDGASHGSGCTHSSALAAFLALGDEPARGRPRGAADRLRGGRRTACARSARAPARSTSSDSPRGRLSRFRS